MMKAMVSINAHVKKVHLESHDVVPVCPARGDLATEKEQHHDRPRKGHRHSHDFVASCIFHKSGLR